MKSVGEHMEYSVPCMNMIKQQLRTGNITCQKILSLYKEINRETFVPEQMKHFAYSDIQIKLPHHERMMTPLEEATILQSLNLQGHETILEIGTGTGFLTALLSRLCKKVISIDYYKEFTAAAKIKLSKYQCDNVELLTEDASSGWLALAPYDAVVFTGSIPEVKKSQQLQVIPGGKMVVLVGQTPLIQAQLHTIDHQGNWHQTLLFETDLPYLKNAQERHRFVF
jgi:protein-L-isoaspartate(D-aspartate) O-methyltransferase